MRWTTTERLRYLFFDEVTSRVHRAVYLCIQ